MQCRAPRPDIVVDAAGLGHLPLVGGCHPALDAYVVSASTKAELVEILQTAGWKVIAAGDSPIDLPMLQRASTRSSTPVVRSPP